MKSCIKRAVFFACSFACFSAFPSYAVEAVITQPSAVNQQLKVGTSEILPFVFIDGGAGNGAPYGYEIDLWNQVADELGFETEWVTYDKFSDMLLDLQKGNLDAAVSGISITAAREAEGFDFSYPTYRSGLQLMRRSPQKGGIITRVAGLFSWNIWRPLLLVTATSAGVGALIWLFEHRHNDHFSQNPVQGIGQGIWFSIVTLGTFGYGDVTPTRLPGRIVACLWMGASFFIVADFIASLTVDQLTENNLSFTDIQGETVGVVGGTTAEVYTRSQPVKLAKFDSAEAAIAALEAGEIAAVVHDYPTLKYVATRNPRTFELVGQPLTQEDYGIAFQEGSNAVLEAINQKILALQEQGYLRQLREKWLDEDQDNLQADG